MCGRVFTKATVDELLSAFSFARVQERRAVTARSGLSWKDKAPAPALEANEGFVRPATGGSGERAGRIHLITNDGQRSSASKTFIHLSRAPDIATLFIGARCRSLGGYPWRRQ